MAFLFCLIAIGYILTKMRFIPDNSEKVLSKLESYIFIPALVMGTFMTNFTLDKLKSSGKLLLWSVAIEAVVIVATLLLVKLLAKDKYTQNIYTYGLCFSNFGFMGNAVVSSLFPDIFLEYVIFTIVLWTVIYLWGVPVLLMDSSDKKGIGARLKNFVNPMFICMIIGIIIGLSGISLSQTNFAVQLVNSAGACMSPVAMLLTGMTIAKINLKEVLKIKSIYVVTFLRLIVYPAVFVAFAKLVGADFSQTAIVCAVCSLAMPLGLNTVVIPSGYGKDTKIAAGMALVSHVMSIATIPVVFEICQRVL